MGPEAILLSVRDDGREGSYRFTCPGCADDVEKRADRKIVALLVSAGVDIAQADREHSQATARTQSGTSPPARPSRSTTSSNSTSCSRTIATSRTSSRAATASDAGSSVPLPHVASPDGPCSMAGHVVRRRHRLHDRRPRVLDRAPSPPARPGTDREAAAGRGATPLRGALPGAASSERARVGDRRAPPPRLCHEGPGVESRGAEVPHDTC